MRVALITTTVYEPTVLRRFHELDPHAQIVVAGDMRTPLQAARLVSELRGHYLWPKDQQREFGELSRSIGWNCIQRRNLAVIWAAKHLSPDVIISIDDDNAPSDTDYFDQIRRAFRSNHAGYVAYGDWLNVGRYATEGFRHRGLPRSARIGGGWAIDGARPVGVANGLIFGDPDIDAVDRYVTGPKVRHYDHDLRAGVAIDPTVTWAPINSQNTAWRRELAPLAFVLPGVGRYDDIWASFIALRVMEATPYCARFGPPFMTQDRHDHDLLRDIEHELYGMRHNDRFVHAVKEAEVDPQQSVLENLRSVLEHLGGVTELDLPTLFFRRWLEAWEQLASSATA